MDVAITGSSGLIGSALAASLRANGHRVRSVVRRAPSGPGPSGRLSGGTDEVRWDPAAGTIDADALAGVDAVVHLAGEGIAEKRWNDAQKRTILDSRRLGTRLIAETVAALDAKPALLSASAIGYYGNRGDEVLTEESGPGAGFLAEVCIEWEKAAQPAIDAGVRTAFLRTGIVLTPRGGALRKLLPLFKLGIGGRMGSGKQWMSWITLDDEVAAITHLLAADVSGPVNLTAPNPVTNAELTKTLGRVLKRPTVVPVPSFGPKLLLGTELATSLLHDSQRVLPARLGESGFAHEHTQLEGALRALLDR